MTEATGSFSVLPCWSHYLDQKWTEQSTSSISDISLSLVVCACKSFFSPCVIQTRLVRVRDWRERGVFEVPFSFGNEFGKYKGNVGRGRDDNIIVKVLWRQMWENTGFKQSNSNESMLTHGVNSKFISFDIKGNRSFLINTSPLIEFWFHVVNLQSVHRETQRKSG